MIIKLAIKWVLFSGVFVGMAAFLPAIRVRSWGSAITAAAIFGVANVVLGFLLAIVIKAAAFLTFGLAFLLTPLAFFVMNVIILKAIDRRLGDDLKFKTMGSVMGMALALSAAGYVAGFIK